LSATPKITPAADDHASSAVRTVSAEIAGLKAIVGALEDGLGASLSAAVTLIKEAKGRVVVSGIGKSGHVARKIASTMASTGTPAFYLHPAEASHGDLGMVAPSDVLLTISLSGETPELKDVINYCKRFAGASGGDHIRARQRPGPRLRHQPHPAQGRGGMSEHARADHLDHNADGPGRRVGCRLAGGAGILSRRFS
jgi:hypothetical protein